MSLERAEFYLDRKRYSEASNELLQVLSSEPENTQALAMLSVVQSELGRPQDGLKTIQNALAIDPEDAYLHYVHSYTYIDLDKYDQAEKAIWESLRIVPENADSWALLSAIYHDMAKWKDSLHAAQKGLQLDPNNTTCLGMQAEALGMLGNKQAAQSASHMAVQSSPDSCFAFTSQGWINLRHRKYKIAQKDFSEALRIDPTHERAQVGMKEALRATFPPYRIMLMWSVMMSKLPQRTQIFIIIGLYVCVRVIAAAGRRSESFGPYVGYVLLAYGVFVLMTWTMSHLADLVLHLHPFGRMALNSMEKLYARWIGIMYLCCAGGFVYGFAISEIGFGVAVFSAIMMIIVGVISKHVSSEMWQRIGAWGLGSLTLLSSMLVLLVRIPTK